MSSCGLRLFCLECGFKSEACERLRREGRCAEPKVYTTGAASRRAMLRMWKRDIDEKKRVVVAERRQAEKAERSRRKYNNACRDSSDVAEGCFEDEWLD